MKMLLETDIGGDPDDFFTICYLLKAGVDIEAILVSPGHPYQVGIVKFICDYCGVNIPIGIANYKKYKIQDYTGFHKKIIDKYKLSPSQKSDGLGYEIAESIFSSNPDITCFCIGALKNFGMFMKRNPDTHIKKFYMQGGFISYDCIDDPDLVRLEKFENKTVCPTYNLNGAVNSGILLTQMNIDDRRFISKNVCHTIIFNSEKYIEMMDYWKNKEKDKPYELFLKAGETYDLQNKEKKFHDPSAAACLLHPEIAKWTEGQLYHTKQGWGTDITKTGSKIITSINYQKLWDHIIKGY